MAFLWQTTRGTSKSAVHIVSVAFLVPRSGQDYNIAENNIGVARDCACAAVEGHSANHVAALQASNYLYLDLAWPFPQLGRASRVHR